MSLPTIIPNSYPTVPTPKFPDSAPFADDSQWRLVVTTNGKVCAWDHKACDTIFTSASQGIVAAKRARDGSVLAIADAQVVMLHRIDEGQDKSYRLKGTQRCRLLQYDHESRNLFFTDSLQNSVQAYSLRENRVADATRTHPSPVTVFAISCDSNLILSCSANPPTIQIYNRLLATTVSVMPQASSAAVVTCAFHPSRKTVFVLAFGDGVLAAYDYTKLSGGARAKREANPGATQASARALHAFRHLHDPSIAGSAGITGVVFVPGHRSRAVTVGEDGRMFLVDFEMQDTLGSWHAGAPATALTIRPVVQSQRGGGGDRKRDKKDDRGGYVVAVGTIHGRCYVFDGHGNKIGERVIDAAGGSVLDVEWVHGAIGLPALEPEPESVAPTPRTSPRKASSTELLRQNRRTRFRAHDAANRSSIYAQGQNPSIALPAPGEEPAGEVDTTLKPTSKAEELSMEDMQETANQGYMKLFSPIKKKRPTKPSSLPDIKPKAARTTDPRARANEASQDHRSAISAPQIWNEQKQEAPKEEPKRDVFDVFQQKENYSEKESRVEDNENKSSAVVRGISSVTSEPVKVSERTDDGQLLNEIRSIRAKVSGRATGMSNGNLALFAPYMPSRVRSTPTGTARGGAANTSVRKSASVPERKNSDDAPPSEPENTLPEQHMDGNPTEPPAAPCSQETADRISEAASSSTSAAEAIEHPAEEAEEEEAEEDEGEDEEEDIWLLESKQNRRSSLKRKEPPPQEEDNSIISHGTSSTRSSKSRKTVSWDDESGSHNNKPSLVLTPAETSGAASSSLNVTRASSSRATTSRPTPLAESAAHRNYNSANLPPLAIANARLDTLLLPHTDTNSENRTTTTTTTSTTGPGLLGGAGAAAGLDPALAAALRELQKSVRDEVHGLTAEMQRQFREQRAELAGLRSEMARVREENEKLRGQLFRMSGVRETVRKASGSGERSAVS